MLFNWKCKVDIVFIGYGVLVDLFWWIEGEEICEYLGFFVLVIKVIEIVEFFEYMLFIDVGLLWENMYFLYKYLKEFLVLK